MSQTYYYAVCDCNGPVSRRLEATTLADALTEMETADRQAWIDEPATDAEDELEICGDGMDEDAFAAALTAAGAEMVQDLEPIHNAHAGTVAHLSGGWRLWCVAEVDEGVEVVPGRQLPWFASERQEKRGLK